MKDKRKVKALLSVLLKSAQSGIHASLSPEDCKILLSILCPIEEPRKHVKNVNTMIDDIQDTFTDLTKAAIDDFLSAVRKTRATPKRRKK
jgi:hypothetical protein